MRISDWSSDVCSSDLHRERHDDPDPEDPPPQDPRELLGAAGRAVRAGVAALSLRHVATIFPSGDEATGGPRHERARELFGARAVEWRSVGSGKGAYVRGSLGGR